MTNGRWLQGVTQSAVLRVEGEARDRRPVGSLVRIRAKSGLISVGRAFRVRACDLKKMARGILPVRDREERKGKKREE